MLTMKFKSYIQTEQKPLKGLMLAEWAELIYLLFTLVIVMITTTKLPNPEAMIWNRVRLLFVMAAMWLVYRLVPCRLTRALRIFVELGLLAWWYPDTYSINRIFPNLDHVVAAWDEQLFGFQPALVFAARFPSHIISELMDMGYVMYYPIIVLVVLYYFANRYEEFERCSFIILAGFFIYYVVFDLMPVAGPTFYYKAVGISKIAHGVFPAIGDYFNTHTDCLPAPGYTNGIFYNLVEAAKASGERPTAAFPSSHVGISTICMLLALRTRNKKLWLPLLPIYLLLCMATVYIQAHYLIDAIAGFVSGVLLYAALLCMSRKITNFAPQKERRR